MKFALDTPAACDLGRVTRFSGWCLTDDGMPVETIFVRIDGLAIARLERSPRWDLVAAFPDFPQAVLGGFAGDVPVPEDLARGAAVEIELVVRHGHSEHSLLRRRCIFAADCESHLARARSYRLADILEQMPTANLWQSAREPGATHRPPWPSLILGTPHFHEPGSIPTLRVLEEGPTNAYSSGAIEVMEAVPAGGLFLDLGCGIRRSVDLRSNGVYLDAVHFRSVDVVNSCARLPLRDACMDAVISLGVFEHLPDPFAMAAEIRRVLRPGGVVWIETAFMQPLHADPGHYFNMTAEGLLRVFADFAVDECGVLSHQTPTFSLRMQIDQALAYMRDGEWKRDLERLRARLNADGAALDEALGPIAGRNLAAGVYLRGRRPLPLDQAPGEPVR